MACIYIYHENREIGIGGDREREHIVNRESRGDEKRLRSGDEV